MPERRAGFGRAGLTSMAVSAANRWNACGKEALVGKGALPGPVPQVKFSGREPA
jgi:hypothetical protein